MKWNYPACKVHIPIRYKLQPISPRCSALSRSPEALCVLLAAPGRGTRQGTACPGQGTSLPPMAIQEVALLNN